jgi:hypothetical protein
MLTEGLRHIASANGSEARESQNEGDRDFGICPVPGWIDYVIRFLSLKATRTWRECGELSRNAAVRIVQFCQD